MPLDVIPIRQDAGLPSTARCLVQDVGDALGWFRGVGNDGENGADRKGIRCGGVLGLVMEITLLVGRQRIIRLQIDRGCDIETR